MADDCGYMPEWAGSRAEFREWMLRVTEAELRADYEGATGHELTRLRWQLVGEGRMDLAEVVQDMAVGAYEAEDAAEGGV